VRSRPCGAHGAPDVKGRASHPLCGATLSEGQKRQIVSPTAFFTTGRGQLGRLRSKRPGSDTKLVLVPVSTMKISFLASRRIESAFPLRASGNVGPIPLGGKQRKLISCFSTNWRSNSRS
jgi:hypothetical protein